MMMNIEFPRRNIMQMDFVPSNDFNKTTKCTYGELYDNTYKRESEIRGLGYNLVVMWESDWIRINNAIRKLQKKYSLRKTIN